MIELLNDIIPDSKAPPQEAEKTARTSPKNNDVVLADLVNEIATIRKEAKKASKDSLLLHKMIGEKLIVAKEVAGHGKFGIWAEENGYKREWRRHLMSLAEHWDVLDPYLEGDGSEGVGYSVKEACEIIDRHLGRGAASKTDKQQKPAGEKSENSPAERACRNRSDTITREGEAQADPPQPEASQTEPTEPTLAEENARLSAELKAANERIETLLWEKAGLESEVAVLKANEAKYLSGGFLMEKAATGHLPV